jgi:UTP--glucose-1-phosphate uridylyltransferase
MVPKLDAGDWLPSAGRSNRRSSGARPATATSTARWRAAGILASLLERGFRYAMIANADNLGATPDERIAGYLAREAIPFLMEVVEGTAADRKGGHIARRIADGSLVLRETAQTPPEDLDSFRDYRRWRYYNTNNLWVDLNVLARRWTPSRSARAAADRQPQDGRPA